MIIFAYLFSVLGAAIISFLILSFNEFETPVAFMLSFLSLFMAGGILSIKDIINKEGDIGTANRIFMALVVIAVIGIGIIGYGEEYKGLLTLISEAEMIPTGKKILLGWLAFVSVLLTYLAYKDSDKKEKTKKAE